MKNQKGFGTIELLLVALIFGAISFVAYYIYRQRPAPNETPYQYGIKLQDNVNVDRKISEIPTVFENNISNWKRFENRVQGIYFMYPPDWTVSDSGLFKQQTSGWIDGPVTYTEVGRIVINSPELGFQKSKANEDSFKGGGVQLELIYGSRYTEPKTMSESCQKEDQNLIGELKTENKLACYEQNEGGYYSFKINTPQQHVILYVRKGLNLSSTRSREITSIYYDVVRSLDLR